MKVAVIGGGGREHTLAWKLAQSPSVDKLYAIPGSAAMSEVAQCVDIALSDLDAITDYAKNEGIDMLVVGPEVPLTEGIADLAQSPRPILRNRAHRSSSRPMAWLPARASSSPRRKQKPSKPSTP